MSADSIILLLYELTLLHKNQQFDFFAILIYYLAGFSIASPLTRALVLFPLLMYGADILYFAANYISGDDAISLSVSAPLFFVGQLFGDSYLCFKSLSRVEAAYRVGVWMGFGLVMGIKLCQIGFRLYALAARMDAPAFYDACLVLDSVMFAISMFFDTLCWGLMAVSARHEKGTQWSLRSSTLFRMSVLVCIRLVLGSLKLAFPVPENNVDTLGTAAIYAETFSVVNYQLYYFDYLLDMWYPQQSSRAGSKLTEARSPVLSHVGLTPLSSKGSK
ncbi:hypothetical protein HDU91_001881 [Kappamyces sp. JEL0680]|nr:hypothetical protein HDU91_001881 [Kappamyces sp. JEL0680]